MKNFSLVKKSILLLALLSLTQINATVYYQPPVPTQNQQASVPLQYQQAPPQYYQAPPVQYQEVQPAPVPPQIQYQAPAPVQYQYQQAPGYYSTPYAVPSNAQTFPGDAEENNIYKANEHRWPR